MSNKPCPRTILYVHSSDELYGADRVLLQLLDHLDASLFRAIVVVPTDLPYEGLLTRALAERGIPTVHLRTAVLRRKYLTPWGLILYLSRLVLSTISLIRLIRREAVMVVHSNTLAVVPGALAAWSTGRPHIWHVHEIIDRPRWLWRVTAWLAPRLSVSVVAVSNAARDHLCAGDTLNAEKAIVIHNGIDAARFAVSATEAKRVRAEWGVRPEQFLVGMVGRVSDRKGQDYFLEVARRVRARSPDTRFAIVGAPLVGREHLVEKLKFALAEVDLSSAVIFGGFRQDTPAVMNALDLLILPSKQPEAFGLVALEAMAAGKPVVANALGGVVEVLEDGFTGLLVRPDRAEEMADAICSLLRDPAKRLRMGACGRDRVIRSFSLQTSVAQWQALYGSMNSARQRQSSPCG